MTKKLREGFTTGSAVAGAAKAAFLSLINGSFPKNIDIPLPPFEKGEPRARLNIPVDAISFVQREGMDKGSYVVASVIKDGGDDPDATSGITIHVIASFAPLCEILQHSALTGNIHLNSTKINAKHKEILSSLHRDPWKKTTFFLQYEKLNIVVGTGVGIGVVTLPGLPVSIGEPAVNPEPRKQLYAAVKEALPAHIQSVYLYIEAPEGLTRAKNTLNPKLGIKGGISILGTHGVVKPYSHEAFTQSISQGLDIAIALGLKKIFLTTGRRSERLLLARYPEQPPQAGVQVADYAAHAVRDATLKGIEHIVWGCFLGKLVKLSQGLEWTHASQGAPDMHVLSELWTQAGGDISLTSEIIAMPTAAGAFSLMESSNTGCFKEVIAILGKKALSVLHSWCKSNDVKITLHIFSLEGELLLTLTDR